MAATNEPAEHGLVLWIPSTRAALCLDCSAIYDGSTTRWCPACASGSSVGLEEYLAARRPSAASRAVVVSGWRRAA